MREFSALGVGDELLAAGIENRESRFFNRFGQLIYKEPRGKFAGYQYPEVGIHRGRLHLILYEAARERLGADAIPHRPRLRRRRAGRDGVTVHFRSLDRRSAAPVRADVAIACDGINSAIRKQFYPDDKLAFAGINTWRGVTRRKPILGGRTYMRVGSILTGKIVIYPIIDNIDGEGNQLINWMAEIKRDTLEQNDWNKPGDLADFFPIYENWRFDWLDVGADDPRRRPDPGISDGRQGPDRALDFRPRHAGRRRRASDVSARLQRRGAGGDRRPHARRPAGAARPIRATRSRPTRRRARAAPPRWCAPTASTRRISSTSRSRNWSATGRSTISTNTSRQDELRALSENYKRIAGFSLADVAPGGG